MLVNVIQYGKISVLVIVTYFSKIDFGFCCLVFSFCLPKFSARFHGTSWSTGVSMLGWLANGSDALLGIVCGWCGQVARRYRGNHVCQVSGVYLLVRLSMALNGFNGLCTTIICCTRSSIAASSVWRHLVMTLMYIAAVKARRQIPVLRSCAYHTTRPKCSTVELSDITNWEWRRKIMQVHNISTSGCHWKDWNRRSRLLRGANHIA